MVRWNGWEFFTVVKIGIYCLTSANVEAQVLKYSNTLVLEKATIVCKYFSTRKCHNCLWYLQRETLIWPSYCAFTFMFTCVYRRFHLCFWLLKLWNVITHEVSEDYHAFSILCQNLSPFHFSSAFHLYFHYVPLWMWSVVSALTS